MLSLSGPNPAIVWVVETCKENSTESMSYAAVVVHIPPCFIAVRAAARNKQPSKKTQSQKPPGISSNGFGGKKRDPVWQCVQNCGACCKLDKGPSFPSPQDIFDDPSDVQLYESLIGPDGWCINYEKSTRKCSIYAERPYFCRVEPEVFDLLYGISKSKFNKEACSCCTDTIKAVYGIDSEELQAFNHAVWTNISK